MVFDPAIHHRKSIRLKDYDYALGGAYFITICCAGQKSLFGKIQNEAMHLNAFGRIALQEWQNLLERFPDLSLAEFIIMPNHMHGILVLEDPVGATLAVAQRIPDQNSTDISDKNNPTVGNIINAYKSIVALQCLKLFKQKRPGQKMGKLWHRNYYERIIRDVREYENIADYIRNNPFTWLADRFYVI